MVKVNKLYCFLINLTVLFLFFYMLVPFADAISIPLSEQYSYINADMAALAEQDYDSVLDTYILFSFITQKNKRQSPIVSYLVAKRTVEHVNSDYRFSKMATKTGFLSLIVGIMQVESGFNPLATSEKDARGLMQVHYPTWKNSIRDKSIYDMQNNLLWGTSILHTYYTAENGNLKKALYRYYGAPDDSYVTKIILCSVRFKKFYTEFIGTLSPNLY